MNYYNVQEWYDEITLQAKQNAWSDAADMDKRANVIEILQEIFPGADAEGIMKYVETEIDTFMAIGKQYKADIEGARRYKDVLLIEMVHILQNLQPYEYILHYLYPHMTPLFHSLMMWYDGYLIDNTAPQS